MMTIRLPSILPGRASPPRLASLAVLAAVACAALAGSAVTTPANAWCCGGFHGGVFIGIPPIVVGPPAYPYYAPPAYYPPPPAYYAPPPSGYAPPPSGYAPPPSGYAPPPTAYAPPPPQQSDGQSCTAGPYVCPMDHPVASGSSCYCLGNNRTQVWGRAS